MSAQDPPPHERKDTGQSLSGPLPHPEVVHGTELGQDMFDEEGENLRRAVNAQHGQGSGGHVTHGGVAVVEVIGQLFHLLQHLSSHR